MLNNFTDYIKNIKFRCLIKKNFFTCICYPARKTHPKNFCVFKHRFVYIVFKYNTINTVNITKVKRFSDIKVAIDLFLQYFNLSPDILVPYSDNTFVKIDNIVATGKGQTKNNKDISLYQIYSYLKTDTKFNFYCHLRNTSFPTLYLTCKNISGKILLFRSNKFCIVGVKCMTDLVILIQKLNVLMMTL